MIPTISLAQVNATMGQTNLMKPDKVSPDLHQSMCKKGSLKQSFGLDLGGKNYLREQIVIPEIKVRHEKVTV